MSNVVRSSFQAASRELIARLVKAGYLRAALRHDADAITAAIARLKRDLRSGGGDDESPTAACAAEHIAQHRPSEMEPGSHVGRAELQCPPSAEIGR
jgi:hypothetical protein